jgi:chromosome segregation ATPase
LRREAEDNASRRKNKSLLEILAAKQKDLTEMKSQLTAQTQNLKAKITALEADEHRRDQATAEIERLHALVGMLEDALHASEQGFENSTNELNRLQTVVDALNKELRKKDADLQEAQSSDSVIPDGDRPTMAQLERLRQHNRDLKQQKKDLQSDLEQAQEEVRKALEIAASAASRSLKRSRVKDEINDEIDDSPRLSYCTRKRARHENVLSANSNAQAVIALD